MKTLSRTLFAGIASLLLLSNVINAQIQVIDAENVSALKKGTTFVVMKDTASESAQAYIELFRKYWTISRVEFIKPGQIQANAEKNNFFLSIGVFTANTTASNNSLHMFLGLWTCKDGYLDSKPNKKLSWQNTIILAKIELATDYYEMGGPDAYPKYDYYSTGNHITNWGLGVVKNYIQELVRLLEAEKDHSMIAASHDESQLKVIKQQILYVPDYILLKTGLRATTPENKSTEKEIFSEYRYPYKLITMDELNIKILNDSIPFYYLICVMDEPDKFVSIFNSQTGEMIYTGYSPMGYKFKKEDMLHITETMDNKGK